jgi:uncharacterized protein (DUF2147 family)
MKSVFLITLFSLIGSSIVAQSDITGTWNTGDQNTIVKIENRNDVITGKIVSSDNPKAKVGSLLIKDVTIKRGKWKGQLYAPKKDEWYDAEFTNKENILEVVISAGLMRKTVEWTKEGDK